MKQMVKRKGKNKEISKIKYIWLIGIVLLIAIVIFTFLKINNKTGKIGNNKIDKTTEGITEYILNISSYNAKIEVTVKSNKNTNEYKLEQQYVSPNLAKQVVKEPSNIQDLTMISDGKNVTIENTKLNLTTLYENYHYLTENHLFLNYFVEDYKNSNEAKAEEKDGLIILQMKAKNQNNKYSIFKKLYIDKNTAKPVKMEVQDVNQNTIVYILYNEININSTKKEEIIAFSRKDRLTDI